jgi:hypothetical protein
MAPGQRLVQNLSTLLRLQHSPLKSSSSRMRRQRRICNVPTTCCLSSTSTNSKVVDTLIIGGGPIGLSTAFHLASRYRNNDGSNITIVERDPTYARSSAVLSAGGIRQQVRWGREEKRRDHDRDIVLCITYTLNDDDLIYHVSFPCTASHSLV